MLTLVFDVINDRFFISTTARKGTIFFTPTTELREIDLLLCPLATSLLDITYKVAQCNSRSQFNEHVNVVAYAIDAIKTTTTTLHY